MIADDLDEDVDETIQYYARKKRKTSRSKGALPSIIMPIIILIIFVVVVLYLII